MNWKLFAAGAVVAIFCGCRGLPDTRPQTAESEQKILESGGVVCWAGPNQSGPGRTGTAVILINADPYRVWDLLKSYNRYHEFFPRTRRSLEIIRTKYDTAVLLEFDPLLIYDAWVIIQVWEKEDGALTISCEKRMGPVKTLQGSWTVERYGGGTKLTFRSLVEVDYYVPAWAWHIMESLLLPSAVENVKKMIEKGKTLAAKPAG